MNGRSAKIGQADVIIVGGGMVGLTLACALKDTGLHVLVIERAMAVPRMSLGRDCRVSAIVAGTIQMLRGIGVWPFVEAKAGPIMAMRVWDDQHFGSIRFEATEADLESLGAIVENSLLQTAMLDVLTESDDIEWICPTSVESVRWRSGHVEVRLDDGRRFATPLVVGADGGRSWLRTAAGIGTWRHGFGQQGIVATVRPQFSHRQTAFQRFLPTGPLAFLPLGDDLCSIVWSAEDSEAGSLMALDDASFLTELQHAFGPILGRLEAVGARAAFPLCSRLARHLIRPRLALIGDAAHQVHPLAGLGVNLGIRDAMVLAQEIADAHRFREDYGSMDILGRFMRARMPDVLSVMAGMEGFHHLFTNHVPGLALLRDAGMLAVSNAGSLKHMLMRRAMGLTLPVPKQIV